MFTRAWIICQCKHMYPMFYAFYAYFFVALVIYIHDILQLPWDILTFYQCCSKINKWKFAKWNRYKQGDICLRFNYIAHLTDKSSWINNITAVCYWKRDIIVIFTCYDYEKNETATSWYYIISLIVITFVWKYQMWNEMSINFTL